MQQNKNEQWSEEEQKMAVKVKDDNGWFILILLH